MGLQGGMAAEEQIATATAPSGAVAVACNNYLNSPSTNYGEQPHEIVEEVDDPDVPRSHDVSPMPTFPPGTQDPR